MELTETQYARIEPCLPRQRGNVSMPNLRCSTRVRCVAMPKRFGNWHTRMNRWSKNGVLDRVFEHLQCAQLIRIKLEAVSLDSTVVKVHPDGTGARKKTVPRQAAIGKSRGGWTTKIHLVAADARTALTFALSPGQAHDSPEELLASMGPQDDNVALVMDRAYQGDETRQLALDLGFTPVVPPLKTRTDPWEYDREMYKRRNEVERLFRRLKGYDILPIREAGCDVHRLQLRAHLRRAEVSVNRP